MATKYICDRCGKEIDPTSRRTVVGYCGERKLSDPEYFDLCGFCAFKLKNFLNGEKENDK